MSNIDGISEPLKGKDLDEWLLKHSEVEADAHDSSEYESKGLNRKVSGGRNSVKDMAKAGAGALETAMSAATGILSNVTGGYLGLGRATWNLASGEEIGKSFARGGETARRVSEGGTYEPRTDAGKAYTQVANLPVEVGSKVGGKVGGSIGQAVGGDEGEAIGQSVGESIVPMGLAVSGPLMSKRRTGDAFATGNPHPVAGKQYTPLRDLDAKEQERYVTARNMGVKPTLGQVTGDARQLDLEARIGNETAEGIDLKQRRFENNAAIKRRGAEMDTKRSGERVAKTSEEVSGSILNTIKEKANKKYQEYKTRYKTADDAKETQQQVNPRGLLRYLDEERHTINADPQLGAIYKKIEDRIQDKGFLTVADMEDVYQRAGRAATQNNSHYVGEIKRHVNNATRNKGGELYQSARTSRLEYAKEFENQKALSDIIGTRSGYAGDAVIDSVKIADRVLDGRYDDLVKVTHALLHAEEQGIPGAKQSVRDLQGRMMDRIIEEGYPENGKNMDPRKLQNLVEKKIGRAKIRWLLGEEVLGALQETWSVASTLYGGPTKAGAVSPGKLPREALRMELTNKAEKHAAGMPYGIGEALNIYGKVKQRRALSQSIDEALNPQKASPEAIKEEARPQRAANRLFQMREGAIRATPAFDATLRKEENEDDRKKRIMNEAAGAN